MDLDFCKFVLKRLAIAVVILGIFCLFPGPRSILEKLIAYLSLPESVASLGAGLHLSLLHYCWLLGFELPPFEFPQCAAPILAASAIVLSIAVQLVVLQIAVILWRSGWHLYYRRKEMAEVRAEFGELLNDTELKQSTDVLPPPRLLKQKQLVEAPRTSKVSELR